MLKASIYEASIYNLQVNVPEEFAQIVKESKAIKTRIRETQIPETKREIARLRYKIRNPSNPQPPVNPAPPSSDEYCCGHDVKGLDASGKYTKGPIKDATVDLNRDGFCDVCGKLSVTPENAASPHVHNFLNQPGLHWWPILNHKCP